MDTKIVKVLNVSDEIGLLKEAAEILIKDGLVAFPTETVYGIGANALSEEAVKKIYVAKGRPSDNPLIAHIHHQDEVSKYAREIPENAKNLINAFWPGPLTIIFKRSDVIKDCITGGLDTVALRMPENEIARKLIELSGLPIAAPSANLSGRPSPTDAKHVIEDLNGRVDMIIDGGSTQIGLESTVVDVTSDIPTILRPGKITKEMMEQVVGQVCFDPALLQTEEDHVPKSPGMKYKHYAPKGRVTVVQGSREKAIKAINNWVNEKEASGYKVAVISTEENAPLYKGSKVKVIGSKHDHDTIAANLFAILREMDEEGIEYIYSRAFREDDIGHATMNRLMKAAGNVSIDVEKDDF